MLELLPPPGGHEFVPLTCKALTGVLGGSVEAAVLTSLPVHLEQCGTFNGAFYEALGKGESVVAATQLARTVLKDDKPAADAAGFGWFAVITGPQSEFYLTRRVPKTRTASDSYQPRWEPRDV